MPSTRSARAGVAAAHSPNAPSTCTHAPTSWAAAIASRNGSNDPECTLPACKQTRVGPAPVGESRAQGSGVEAPLLIAGHELRLAEPEVSQRHVDRAVPLGPREHPDPRCAAQPIPGNVPSAVGEHGVPARREPGEVRHRRAGHEPDGRPARKVQRIEQPPPRRILDRHDAGRRIPHPRVLIPGAHQPVGGERRGQSATHHPAEEPAGWTGHQSRLDVLDQIVGHLTGRAAVLGDRLRQPGCQGRGIDARRRSPIGERVEPALRVGDGCGQFGTEISHPARLSLR